MDSGWGSRLEDFEIDAEQWPGEARLRQSCIDGERCVFGDGVPLNEATERELSIRAAFLRYLLLGGCERTTVHRRGVRLTGARICCETPSRASADEAGSLDLEAEVIVVDLALNLCHVEGSVVLRRAETRTIDLSGSVIDSLHGDGLRATGDLRLTRGFHASGQVRLAQAEISGSLDARDGHFDDTDISLLANRTRIGGDAILSGLTANGSVSLSNATVGGDVTTQGGAFLGAPALQLRNTTITGTFFWRSIRSAPGEVDLRGASCALVNMDERSWLRKRRDTSVTHIPNEASDGDTDPSPPPDADPDQAAITWLQGFKYGGFVNLEADYAAKFWYDWLEQQPEHHHHQNFRPQPFEQLANVLDTMGHEAEALSIRIRKEHLKTRSLWFHERHRSGPELLNKLQIFWRVITRAIVDYGYRPGKALIWLVALIGLGTPIFWYAGVAGVMTPTHPLIFKEAHEAGRIDPRCAENWVHFVVPSCTKQMPSEYSEFSALMYSADIALPIINFRQQSDWAPRVVNHQGENSPLGRAVRVWEWLETVLGWALSLLFVSAIGGIIRR
ncbi:MAG: hypothetical protein AAF493_05615 [Pseudomonadota bacterium]